MKLTRMDKDHGEEILGLWNKELGSDFPMTGRLLTQTVFEDPNWLSEGSWVAKDSISGRVIGFVSSKHPGERLKQHGIGPDSGWIQSLLVASEARRAGVGEELLRHAESALRDAGSLRIALGNDLHHRLFPGIPAHLSETRSWFEKRGYACKEIVHDLFHAYGETPQVPLPDLTDASVRIATERDREALSALMTRCFPGAWDYQHREYWRRGGSGREYVLLERGGELIGFCRINDTGSLLLAQNIYWSPSFREPLGGIGPLGIDERYRGHQYGIKIVQAAIHYLLTRGSRRIVIDTTPFVDFYGKLGYTTWKTYAKYAKQWTSL